MRFACAGAIGVAVVRGAPAAASPASVCPNGVRTQSLRFRIETVGYVGQGEHVALFADVRALVAMPAAVIGNGIVVGEV
jgi:hypothetical protein